MWTRRDTFTLLFSLWYGLKTYLDLLNNGDLPGSPRRMGLLVVLVLLAAIGTKTLLTNFLRNRIY